MPKSGPLSRRILGLGWGSAKAPLQRVIQVDGVSGGLGRVKGASELGLLTKFPGILVSMLPGLHPQGRTPKAFPNIALS